MHLENLMYGLLVLLVLIGIGAALLCAADWIMDQVIRVFPKLDEWLKSLPLGH